ALPPSTLKCTPATAPETVAAIENALDIVAPSACDVIDTPIGAWPAVKSAVTSAPLIVTLRLVGVNEKPGLVGMTAYDPLSSPVKVKRPDGSAFVVAVAAPPRSTFADAPLAGGAIAPEIENVCATTSATLAT